MGRFWSRSWDSNRGAARDARPRPGRRFLPAVEGLEERALPAFFPALAVGVGDAPGSVAVGDFNGDGKKDLAAASLADDTVTVRLGQGGSFGAPQTIAVGNNPRWVAVGDFN